jgi:hypothetical protein
LDNVGKCKESGQMKKFQQLQKLQRANFKEKQVAGCNCSIEDSRRFRSETKLNYFISVLDVVIARWVTVTIRPAQLGSNVFIA